MKIVGAVPCDAVASAYGATTRVRPYNYNHMFRNAQLI